MDIWIAKLFKSGRVKRFAQSLHSRSSWATATSVSRSRLIAAGLCQWEGRGVDCDGANSERHYVASHRRARKSAQTRVAQCTVSRDLPAMGRLHTFVVTLRRDTRDTNWGLRLVGGADLATPLIVTRVRTPRCVTTTVAPV